MILCAIAGGAQNHFFMVLLKPYKKTTLPTNTLMVPFSLAIGLVLAFWIYSKNGSFLLAFLTVILCPVLAILMQKIARKKKAKP